MNFFQSKRHFYLQSIFFLYICIIARIGTTFVLCLSKIYNYLSDKGEVTINKLRKDMDLDDNFTYMGLGWLSREDKIAYTQKPK